MTSEKRAAALLATLESLGLSLRAREDGRIGTSPTNLLTAELGEGIRQHKEELLGLLRARDAVRPESLWPGVEREGWEANPFRWKSWTQPDEDTPDLPELVAWWDREGRTAALPLTLAVGVVLTSIETMDRWINTELTAGRRTAVSEQLRRLRRAAEAREKEQR